MAMIGGPSELKVADEEVQKICDEVCSTFFSNFWCCDAEEKMEKEGGLFCYLLYGRLDL